MSEYYIWAIIGLIGLVVGIVLSVLGRKDEFIGTLKVETLNGEDYLYLDMEMELSELKTKKYATVLVDISGYIEPNDIFERNER